MSRVDRLALAVSLSVYITPVPKLYDGHPSAVAGHAVRPQRTSVKTSRVRLFFGSSLRVTQSSVLSTTEFLTMATAFLIIQLALMSKQRL